LKKPDAHWVNDFAPSPALSKYVNRDAVPPVAGSVYDPGVSFIHLRPLTLNYWLRSWEAAN
jgi:hypothetical protein